MSDAPTIIRKNRRSIAISIAPDNTVKIIVPLKMTEEEISTFLKKKDPWIKKIISKNNFSKTAFDSGYGTDEPHLLYLGQPYAIKLMTHNEQKIFISDKQLYVCFPPNDPLSKTKATKEITKWAREQAVDIINDRVLIQSEKLNLQPNQVRIKTLKSRWGSCSFQKNLNFSWTLIMTPLEVIDYVVIHELCHIVQMNHSEKFWALVEKYDPDYKDHLKWLRTYGPFLKVPML